MKKIMLSLLGALSIMSTAAMAEDTSGAVKTVEERNNEIAAETAGVVFRMGNNDKGACSARIQDETLKRLCEQGWEKQNERMNQPAKY